MAIDKIIFGVLLAMCVVLLSTFFVAETPVEEIVVEGGDTIRQYQGHGVVHPEFSTMQHGGHGVERQETIIWFGLVYGLLMIVLFVCCLALGSAKGGKVGPFAKPLVMGGFLFAGIFAAMVHSYAGYVSEEQHALFLSLPQPTAWMVYGLWALPIIFILLFVVTFDRWNLRKEDIKKFEELVSARRGERGEGT